MNCLRSHMATGRLSIEGLRGLPGKTPIPSMRGHKSSLIAGTQQKTKAPYTTQPLSTKRPSRSPQFPLRAKPPHLQSPGIHPQVHARASYSSNATPTIEPTIHNIFEPVTGTWQYIVADPSTLCAVIIDPVLNYEPATQAISTTSADSVLALATEQGYKISKILETHAHADHLTAASYIQKRLFESQGFKPLIGIGKRIEQVQTLFGKRYGLPSDEYTCVFDELFEDDEIFTIGDLTATAIHLPGHTPDHLGYKIGDNVFCGDSLFHVDIGTARCDFPGGDADNLYASGRKLLSLAEHVKIWPGHDYPPAERDDPIPCMSVADHKRLNKHLKDDISQREFVALRTERDAKLNAPRLLHPSLQINIRGGRLPRPMESGHRMLHLPLKLGVEW